MNHRHHPYGGNSSGSFDSGQPNRAGSGLGPDRTHRNNPLGPRAGGRPGRLGYNNGSGSFENHSEGYNQTDFGPSSSYESFYSNSSGGGAGGPYPPSQNSYAANASGPMKPVGPSGSYNHGPNHLQDNYGSYDNNYASGSNYAFNPADNAKGRIPDDRGKGEGQGRTLFIRNIKYETDSQLVRNMFEEHGEIKTFFDLISSRGMVFVTYFDLRATERAKEFHQGSNINGRPIDVHYSLPREDGKNKETHALQGFMIVTLVRSMSNAMIDEGELRRVFSQFGDVRSIRPTGRRDQRQVEYYDLRACDRCFNTLKQQPFQDGFIEIEYAWDPSESSAQGDRAQLSRPSREERGRNRGGGGGGGGRGAKNNRRDDGFGPETNGLGRGPRGFEDNDRGGPNQRGGMGGRGRGGGPGPYGDREGDYRGGYNDGYDQGYGPPVRPDNGFNRGGNMPYPDQKPPGPGYGPNAGQGHFNPNFAPGRYNESDRNNYGGPGPGGNGYPPPTGPRDMGNGPNYNRPPYGAQNGPYGSGPGPGPNGSGPSNYNQAPPTGPNYNRNQAAYGGPPPPPSSSYNNRPPPANYNSGPPPPPPPATAPVDTQKVQELLAALGKQAPPAAAPPRTNYDPRTNAGPVGNRGAPAGGTAALPPGIMQLLQAPSGQQQDGLRTLMEQIQKQTGGTQR